MTENIHNISDQELLSTIEFPDGWLDGEDVDLYAELKEAAWNILHGNPGMVRNEFIQEIMLQYPAEVVDMYGSDSDIVCESLTEMFDSLISGKLK